MNSYFASEDSQKLSLERQKAMLFLYCLLQFRNNKANNFNALYLVVAYAIYDKYKNANNFRLSVKKAILKLSTNAPLQKIQSTNSIFFLIETKTKVLDKGMLYTSALDYCKKVYSENESLIPKSADRKASEGKAELISIKNLILDFFEVPSMEHVYEGISSIIRGEMSKTQIMELIDQSNEIYTLYGCALLIEKEQFVEAMDKVKQIVNTILESNTVEGSIISQVKIYVAATCILLKAFSIIDNSVFDIKELPTFLCEVLTNPEDSFNLYKKLSLKRTSIARDFVALGLLQKTSMTKLVIGDLLEDKKDNQRVLLGYLLANLEIVNYHNNEKLETLIKQVEITTRHHLDKVVKGLPNELMGGVLASGKMMSSAIISKSLHILVKQAQLLINKVDLKYIVSDEYRKPKEETLEFIEVFSKHFDIHFSPNSSNQIFEKEEDGIKFQRIIGELVNLFIISKSNGLIEILPEQFPKGKWLFIINIGSVKIEKQMQQGVVKFIQLLWQIILLTTIIDLKNNKVNSTLLACMLIRASIINENYIKYSRQMLKGVTEDLGNVLHLYTTKEFQQIVIGKLVYFVYILVG